MCNTQIMCIGSMSILFWALEATLLGNDMKNWCWIRQSFATGTLPSCCWAWNQIPRQFLFIIRFPRASSCTFCSPYQGKPKLGLRNYMGSMKRRWKLHIIQLYTKKKGPLAWRIMFNQRAHSVFLCKVKHFKHYYCPIFSCWTIPPFPATLFQISCSSKLESEIAGMIEKNSEYLI